MRRGMPWWVAGVLLILVATSVAAFATNSSSSAPGNIPEAIRLPAVPRSVPATGIDPSTTITGASQPSSTVRAHAVVIPAQRPVVAEVEGSPPSEIPTTTTTTTTTTTAEGDDGSTPTTSERQDH
jgi:hypothetical protein